MRCLDLRDRRGVVIVIVAIALVVLLGMAAIAIDIGQLYAAKQKGQNACDAATIAAMWPLSLLQQDDLTTRVAKATARAEETAGGNNEVTNWRVLVPDSEDEGVSVDIPLGSHTVTADDRVTTYSVGAGESVTVSGDVSVTYGFARIFGFTGKKVRASATAVLLTTTEVGGPDVINIGVPPSTITGTETNPPIEFGAQYVLRCTSWQGGFLGPGNYLSLRLDEDDSGARDYIDVLAGRRPNSWVTTDPPETVDTEPGKMGMPTYKGVNGRLANETVFTNNDTAYADWLATYNEDTGMFADSSRLVVVPVIEEYTDPITGMKAVRVVGFAGFFIEWAEPDGTIYGRFLEGVVSGETFVPCWPSGSGTSTTTTKSIRLIS